LQRCVSGGVGGNVSNRKGRQAGGGNSVGSHGIQFNVMLWGEEWGTTALTPTPQR